MGGEHDSGWLPGAKAWLSELSHRSLAICLAVAAFASIVISFRIPLIYQLLAEQDQRLQDQFFAWRDALPISARDNWQDRDIVTVCVDNVSARRLGMPLPWPRQIYAYLVRKLVGAGARVIAFDMLFDEQSPLSGTGEPSPRLKALLPADELKRWSNSPAADDKAFADQIKAAGNVVLADTVEVKHNLSHSRSQYFYKIPNQSLVNALGAESGSIGNINVQTDEDNVVRRASLVFPDFKQLPLTYTAFAVRIAEKAESRRAGFEWPGKLLLGERILPTKIRVNFLGPPGTVNSIPFWKAIDWERHIGANPFQNKVVLVGYQDTTVDAGVSRSDAGISDSDAGVSDSDNDAQSTLPANAFLTPTAGFARPMPGLELQATIVANIETGRYLAEPELWEELLLVLLAALLVARSVQVLQGRPWSTLVAISAFAFAWLAAAFMLFLQCGAVIPVLVPILGVSVPAWFLVLIDQNLYFDRERRKHTRVFRYLTRPELAQEIDRRQLKELGLQGKRATVTTLSCQLHNFLSITREKTPEAVIQMLHECVQLMIECVHEHNGLVNRPSNYGIMAIWGAPLPSPEETQCRLAARCALQIQDRLHKLAELWQRDGRINSAQRLKCWFGIAGGEAACGRIGTESHSEYMIVGQDVDLSGFLESLNRRYGTQCLISERTAQIISEDYECREIDKLKVDNEHKAQYIHELLCDKGQLPGAMDEATAIYRLGMAAMEERNFEEAARLFSTILRLVPDDQPTAMMLGRCRVFLQKPPEPGWDGATLMADML